jgi:CHAT domain-containing protein/Tfp pilus assembly protein PilF
VFAARKLGDIGRVYRDLGEKGKALDYYGKALQLFRALGDGARVAMTLSNIGQIYLDSGDKRQALDYYNQALPMARAAGDRATEAWILTNIGTVESAIFAAHAAMVPPGAATVPAGRGRAAGKLALHQPIERELGPGQFDVFTVDVAAGQFLHVVAEKKGVDVVVVLADPQGKPAVTADIGRAFGREPASLIADGSGEYQVLVEKSPRSSETGRYRIELTDLHSPTEQDRTRLQAETEVFAALANNRTQDREKQLQAIAGYQRAAALWHSLGDDGEEALCWHRIGYVYFSFGEEKKALDYYNQSLTLSHAVGDRATEAATLIQIGLLHSFLGEKREALDYNNLALPLLRAVGDSPGEALILFAMGLYHEDLGEKQQALEYHNKALAALLAVENPEFEARTLGEFGKAYRDRGELGKAVGCYSRALQPFRALGDRAGEAMTLRDIGQIYSDFGEKRQALDYYSQSLALARAAGDRATEAWTLTNIGALESAIFTAGAVMVPAVRARAPLGTPPLAVRHAGKLALHQPLERGLGPGQTDVFTVDVTAGLFLHVLAEKMGVDVVVVLADPNGNPLVTADINGAFGKEVASLIADGSGRYQVRVEKSPRSSETGRYRIELTDLHSPTEQDRTRLQAEAEFRTAGAVLTPSVQAPAPPGGAAPEFVVRETGKLALHQPVERKLGPGQMHVFTANLVAGQFLHVVVEKKGVDVVVLLADPQGNLLATADSSSGAFGFEPASLVADGGGDYQIRVKKSPRSSETGWYRIELTDLRDPTRQDGSLQAGTIRIFDGSAAGTYRAKGWEERFQAVVGYQRAATLWHSLRDGEEALCLESIGRIYSTLAGKAKALDYYDQALLLERAMGDRAGEANTLNNIGVVFGNLGKKHKALDYYNQSLTLSHVVGDLASEAATLNNIGAVYREFWENARDSRILDPGLKALDSYKQALPLFRAIRDPVSEAATLNNIGVVYGDLGEKRNALDYYNQALSLFRALKDSVSEAATLNNIGVVYRDLGENEKALDYFHQALPPLRAVGNRVGEAGALRNIGNVFLDLGEKQKALGYYNQALKISQAMIWGDEAGTAAALNDIGVVYASLGENQKALDYYNQALPTGRKVDDRVGESTTLNYIGDAYLDMGEYQKALAYYSQALQLARAVGDHAREADALTGIGEVYSALGMEQKALGARGIMTAWTDLYSDLDMEQKALGPYTEALRLARAVSDPRRQGSVLSGLMRYWQANQHPVLATFFGKQAVNLYQEIRRNIQGLEPDLQRSYLASVTGTYRGLADLLIAQGRLAEAEQVLGLLKEQEYFDYVRRDAAEASAVNGRANLNPQETEWDQRYREISDQLVAIGAARGELLAKEERTPEETLRLDQLEKDVAVGNMAFEKFLGDLAQRFSDKPAAVLQVGQLRETQGLMEDLRELPPGTVAIYTLAGEDKFRAILRTSDVQKAYEYPIRAADLNRKVLAFRQVAQNPKLDPRPLAEELYKILVGPMAEDLRQAKAQTLMWSLDGVLRYLPLAALYDGKQYLIERYRVSVMTLASNARLKDRPDAEWKGAGFGVTKAYEGAPALPWVSAELAGIIATKPGDAGVLAGEIELDDAFTQQAMRQILLKRYPVVHIASHFRFEPGNETQSFLLLGDGGHLSLAELKTSANLFGGVQLLTLSACNTGMGDGTEVEGFGTLAQRQGAKAVIASLWPVVDQSTSVLMQRFYRIRESSPGKTKLEALREAQLELLRGTAKRAQGAEPVRILVHEPEEGKPTVEAPRFPVDPEVPYAHPYYWAPFFLMGNWL